MVYSLPVCPFYTLSRIIAHELGIPISIMLVFPKSSFGISKRLLTLLIVWKCCEKMQVWLPKALASSCHVTPAPKSGAWAWWKKSQRVMADIRCFHSWQLWNQKKQLPVHVSNLRKTAGGLKLETRFRHLGGRAQKRWNKRGNNGTSCDNRDKLWPRRQLAMSGHDTLLQKLQEAPHYLTANDHICHPVDEYRATSSKSF